MKLILSGTDRPGSNSRKVSDIIAKLLQDHGEANEILDLAEMQIVERMQKSHYGKPAPAPIQKYLDQINQCEGLIVVCPEYNGSMPGILKWFIDHLKYPDAFEARPVSFVGLGGMFGGLRAVEHLQQVFGYRNSYIFPERVFLTNIFKTLKDGELTDAVAMELLKKQVSGFCRFCRALQGEGLDALSLQKKKV